MNKPKYWTVGQIDATGVTGPHVKELKDISKSNYHLFVDINMDTLKKIILEDIGAKIENLGFNEDWTITLEMFPEVNIHLAFTYFGDEFGDDVTAEFRCYFSGDRVQIIPGEDSVTYVDIIFDMMERLIQNREPFEQSYDKKSELMEKVLVQRTEPFNLLKDNEMQDLAVFLSAIVRKTAKGWQIKKEVFPEVFVELEIDENNKLDIKFSGSALSKKIGSYHIEFLGIFLINHILRYITLNNTEKELPDICYIMFSRYFTKLKDWKHNLM